ncbi:MAG TPA: rhomboid family intramembrane serine protease [Bacteroidia bacterium]|nr:rhomboid family intramembrane serine protease [Bacteroidia bacterium]
MSIIDDIKKTFREKENVVMQLILINCFVFLFVNILNVFINGFSEGVDYYFAVTTNLKTLLYHPWSLVSYMFLHENITHILFNMLWLYWMGQLFMQYLGSKRLIGTYLLGGISGAVLYIIAYNLIPGLPQNTITIGASGGIMAIIVAVATLAPNQEITLIFFGAVPLKYLALGAFILTSIIDFSNNTGGKITHIGGALFGYLYILQYKKGKDISLRFSTFFERLLPTFKKKSRMKVAYKRTLTDEEYNAIRNEKQKKTDIILDKISKAGYDSLTKEEKEFLFHVSNKK